MDRITYIKRLDYLLELIQKGAVCSPHDLVETFQCSEKTIRKMINDLRDLGHSIEYSRVDKKYKLSHITEK
ncbi:MAG TPA: hypothetical protein DCE41_24420 [Cytophagales bacterium]|nr:hypothetical protein [Cytophagales bacterium]HAA18260.1 hypothetical protein [Cytophagales bacterium]HAP64931.1 hypothetical protein [Cytophagales bacterium]